MDGVGLGPLMNVGSFPPLRRQSIGEQESDFAQSSRSSVTSDALASSSASSSSEDLADDHGSSNNYSISDWASEFPEKLIGRKKSKSSTLTREKDVVVASSFADEPTNGHFKYANFRTHA